MEAERLEPTGLATVLVAVVLATTACRSVGIGDLATPRPVPEASCVVVGFLGGRDSWDDSTKGVRRVALSLRDPGRRIWVETFENRRIDIALAFVQQALDADQDGWIEDAEIRRARIVVYGQSLGGWATVLLARLLDLRRVPIELTIQIDSVGVLDGEVPGNVRMAANFYQDEGRLIAGEAPIRAADPARTQVLGNWELDYNRPPGSSIRVDDLPWWKTAFRVDHARMDRDPRVWSAVLRLLRQACDGDLWRERKNVDS